MDGALRTLYMLLNNACIANCSQMIDNEQWPSNSTDLNMLEIYLGTDGPSYYGVIGSQKVMNFPQVQLTKLPRVF